MPRHSHSAARWRASPPTTLRRVLRGTVQCRSGAKAQMAFRGVPVIRMELRGGANFTKVYVRLPSVHSHYMLRARPTGR